MELQLNITENKKMFAKNKVSKSMIDAVNSVIAEEKKRLINDAEIDETLRGDEEELLPLPFIMM